jgi:hypothetical protein
MTLNNVVTRANTNRVGTPPHDENGGQDSGKTSCDENEGQCPKHGRLSVG